ncbi:MAG: phosphohydrolase, partial [Lentisphaerae bacterium]|nr:phosphohydrolase [Lentisphaerota bacterium]
MGKTSDQIEKLTRVGVALTSEHNLEKLLDLIVVEARGLSNADAGSLYIKEGDRLKFVVSQNDTLARRSRESGTVMDQFKPFPIPISNESISGYIANTAET